MKYTMLKIGVFAACCIGGDSVYSQELLSKDSVKRLLERSSFLSYQEIPSLKTHTCFVPMHGLSNGQTLSTYHYGLRVLKNSYHAPNEAAQVQAVRSHFSYAGKFLQPLTRSEIGIQLEKSSHAFFIFEMEIQKEPHFYLVHPKGVRHFIPITSQMKSEELIASLKNGDGSYYPDLSCFIRNTFASYI